jgi:hypothetical protein
VLVYIYFPHSALDIHKSPNDTCGDSSVLSKLYVFGRKERSAKGFFFGIEPAGFQVLEPESKVDHVVRTVKIFDGRLISTEKTHLHGL